jgi:hypothetical protein
MKHNKWTVGLVTAGVVSLGSVALAEETAQHAVNTLLQSTTLSGYVSTSAIWLFGPSSGANSVLGRAFDGPSKQNGFNLDVVNLTLEKPLDEGQWSAGYKVATWLGPDANTLSSISKPLWGTGNNPADFAIRNAYVDLRAPLGNGLDFKFGVWDTVIGYETAESPNNPNYSRSWAFGMEPVQHTGVLVNYKFNDIISANAGVADRGSDVNNINARSGTRGVLTYLGSITLTAPESAGSLKGATLSAGIVDSGITGNSYNTALTAPPTWYGTTRLPASGDKNPVNYYVGATVPLPIKGLSLGASYDYRTSGIFDNSYEEAIGGYLAFQATEKLKLNGRVEYATTSNPYNDPSFDNLKLLGVTGTIDYSLWANAITRLEVRWDDALNGYPMFMDGTRRNAISLALNVIYKF